MKPFLITTIAAVLLVGCGESQQSAPSPDAKPAEPVAEAAKPTTPPKAVSANKGADPARGINPEPTTAKAPDISIHAAAITGNIEAVKKHIAAGTDVNAKQSNGMTPLHFAAQFDFKELAELLITAGTDVNAKRDDGWTPLHFAAAAGHKEIVELLIANGADVNAKRDGGITPLDDTTRENEFDVTFYGTGTEIADLLRKHGGKTGEELKAAGN